MFCFSHMTMMMKFMSNTIEVWHLCCRHAISLSILEGLAYPILVMSLYIKCLWSLCFVHYRVRFYPMFGFMALAWKIINGVLVI